MTLVRVFGGINYALVFFFGATLSISIAGGCKTRRDLVLVFSLFPIFLALQTASWFTLGVDVTKRLYPLLIHLPLLLALTLALKRPIGLSLISICSAYLCRRLPRCGDLAAIALTHSALAGEIVYTIIIAPIFFFLRRYFVPSAREALAESSRSMLLFGGLPVIYYVFDYATAIYSDLLYSSRIVVELLPTAMGLFYMFYTAAYRWQLQRRTQAELLSSLLGGQLRQAEAKMSWSIYCAPPSPPRQSVWGCASRWRQFYPVRWRFPIPSCALCFPTVWKMP